MVCGHVDGHVSYRLCIEFVKVGQLGDFRRLSLQEKVVGLDRPVETRSQTEDGPIFLCNGGERRRRGTYRRTLHTLSVSVVRCRGAGVAYAKLGERARAGHELAILRKSAGEARLS